jgi:hypothetical protein
MTDETQTTRPHHQTASLVVVILDVIGLLGLLYCATIVAAKFRLIFADLLEGQQLPALTRIILSVPALVYALCMAGAIAGLIWKEVRLSDKSQTLLINIGALIAIIVLFVVLVAALFSPLVVMIGTMQN